MQKIFVDLCADREFVPVKFHIEKGLEGSKGTFPQKVPS